MFQVSCKMKGKVQLAGDKVWAMVDFDRSLFLRTEGGSHAYFCHAFWWIRLNQEYRFLRKGDKEWEQGKPKSPNAID